MERQKRIVSVKSDIQKILSPKTLNSYSPIASRATNEVDYDFAVYARKVKVLISQMPMLRQIFQVERQF